MFLRKKKKLETVPHKEEALVKEEPAVEEKEPTKIKVGNILILIASVLFIYDAIAFQLIPFITDVSNGGTPINPDDNWVLNVNLVTWLLYPVFAIFETLACFGGFAWVYKKGKIQGAAPLICILVIFALIADLLLFILNITNTQNALQIIMSYIVFLVVGVVYLIGWFLTKDDFEY